MKPTPVTGESLAARVLALGDKHKPLRCEVCGGECSWTNDDGRTVHPTCDPESL